MVAYLNQDPLKQIIEDLCSHLIVVFRETAALYIYFGSSTSGFGYFHYCPNYDWKAQSTPSDYGAMPGKFSIFLTAVVKYLAKNINKPADNRLGGALRLGVAAYNDYFDRGFCKAEDHSRRADDKKNEDEENEKPISTFEALETALCSSRQNHLYNRTKFDKDHFISSLRFDITKTKMGYIAGTEDHHWSRVDALFSYNEHLDSESSSILHIDEKKESLLLFKIVTEGLESASRFKDNEGNPENNDEFSFAKIRCPYAQYGKIKMLDEREILGFINLSKLIDKYLNSSKWDMPLSIAVFGRPGSGKSFAIKEIISRVNPGRKSEPLTFNLAQFTSVDQLAEAFHQVHDQALSSNEVPLVIFDEFDSSFNGWLGWLKFFLSPMQDGKFRGKTADYRVGRAIFLFSGGTSYNFDQFKDQIPYGYNEGSSAVTKKEAKLDDFIGRLKGYLDVLGTDEENDQSLGRLVKLRRAILLRSLLEKHAEPIFRFDKNKQVHIARISEEVVKALLETRNYKHGVRSMEAIIQMSRWINEEFVVASLPSSSQLQIHVDLESFKDFFHDTLPS